MIHDNTTAKVHIFTSFSAIDVAQWKLLVDSSPTATWFQTEEAYRFYASLPEMMTPFIVAVGRKEVSVSSESISEIKGIVVGYITKEQNSLKQFFTRRAIIYGGPLLADDIFDEELAELLSALKQYLSKKVIYIESRNFMDFSKWRHVFEQCGYTYEKHLNFHIDTSSIESAQSNIGKHRWKYIRLSLRDGATMVENPTIEQVREFYDILVELYATKVRTPLYGWEFFEKLFYQPSAKYLLVELEGKIIGGTCCVCLESKALYEWFVCGNDNYRKGIRPSSVATWFGMRYAAEHNYQRFDLMGAGKPDEPYGVREFKAEFGGTLVEHGRYLHVANNLLYRIGSLGVKLLRMHK